MHTPVAAVPSSYALDALLVTARLIVPVGRRAAESLLQLHVVELLAESVRTPASYLCIVGQASMICC